MGQTNLHSGNPLHVDYTPGSAVVAGQVVVIGEYPMVANRAIAASELGALGAGGGTYLATVDGALGGPGTKVYWDDATNKLTVTAAAGANKHFGYMAPNSSAVTADGDVEEVVHDPDGSSI